MDRLWIVITNVNMPQQMSTCQNNRQPAQVLEHSAWRRAWLDISVFAISLSSWHFWDFNTNAIRRSWVAPQGVNLLSKLGMPQSATNENRRLAIDMASLLVHWERMRVAESQNQSQAKTANGGSTTGPDVEMTEDAAASRWDLPHLRLEYGLQSSTHVQSKKCCDGGDVQALLPHLIVPIQDSEFHAQLSNQATFSHTTAPTCRIWRNSGIYIYLKDASATLV